MGCDILYVFQKQLSTGHWVDIDVDFDIPRHYFLYAWLTGVSNYNYFNPPVIPICNPRGFPSDFKADSDNNHHDKWMGDFFHSWLSLDEIIESGNPCRDDDGSYPKTYSDLCLGYFIKEIKKIREVTKSFKEARMVFGFDSLI